MDAHALTLFVDIVEAGNLSLAARNMKMSRANISYHLTQLERSVGMQLMRRTTRRVELTDIGQRLYHHGCVIRNEVLAAKESVAVFGKSLHGAVRLSLPTGFGHMVMSSWLIEFKRLYPDIDLDLLFDNRVDDLLREEVDIAVRVMSEPPQQMVAIELAQVRYVTCASIDYARGHAMPERLEELGDVPLITSAVAGRKLRVSAYQDGEERRELTLHPTLASENFQFLREAILASLGVGLVPDYVVRQDVAEGRMVTALSDWRLSVFGTRMFLLRMPGAYQTVATRTLIDFVVQKARSWST
ncbi:LysR family transcriptional regulator [Achromobacter xylosoxidans]|jgi:DNA-binding transcriptional LysR family regulator|uniref:LysR family transcriptional regulator n=1 Tax=Achromobacter spanius TaxID=217203 RepID=A0A2S5GNP8_9BURK|nr:MULTISPECIES: LysR family transcriptional regulator [Achromobacter]AHC49235.1 Transcriptional regulator, LysR family [Achromobacter xylosoxidans NBRC 15126 = ATCC 27061]MDD7991193.1 LysR family transcriptional regulator [Achromobacter xylosoxidans]MDQ6212666.1 LysR family transcriptional regulator [Achromobacter insolitus]MDZ5613341.1 LysR family transcriptional regulator [Achromobacter xylosoxidans]MDZ5624553.1 LysR family transcriptional regulator [Achromobacter xylosoxidans]